jgi:signal transduction histidine kinase
MLDYAQIRSGKFRKNFSRFNIRKAVQKVLDIQKKQAFERKINLFAEFKNISENEEFQQQNASIQDIHSPMMICDEHRIMQVLLCLQSNALKFTEKGYVKIEVSI